MLSCHSLSPWFRKSTPTILRGLSNCAPSELATDAKFRLFPNNPCIKTTGGWALLVCVWKSAHFNGTVDSGEPIRWSIVTDRSCSMNAEQDSTVHARSRQTIMAAVWYGIWNTRDDRINVVVLVTVDCLQLCDVWLILNTMSYRFRWKIASFQFGAQCETSIVFSWSEVYWLQNVASSRDLMAGRNEDVAL